MNGTINCLLFHWCVRWHFALYLWSCNISGCQFPSIIWITWPQGSRNWEGKKNICFTFNFYYLPCSILDQIWIWPFVDFLRPIILNKQYADFQPCWHVANVLFTCVFFFEFFRSTTGKVSQNDLSCSWCSYFFLSNQSGIIYWNNEASNLGLCYSGTDVQFN